MMKRNEGFTLIELIVSIAVSTIVTAGVLSVLLFGMRINAKTANNVKQQNAVNMLSQIVQTVSEESNIVVDKENKTIKNSAGFELVYSSDTIKLNGTVFMEDVISFEPEMDESNKLLTLTVKIGETREKSTEYVTKAYCRLYQPLESEGGTAE